MHTGTQFTSSQQPADGPVGRGTALLVGGIAFAAVFLLIVGGTVGYLVLRPGGGDGDGTTATATTATVTSTPAEEETSTAPPTDVEEERCWSPEETSRTSKNPSGKLRGGGLEFIPPELYDGRGAPYYISFANDLQGASALVEQSWYSTMFVGSVEWQPGVEYPGAEEASKRIVSCFLNAPIWGEAKGRSLNDVVTEPVVIDGMKGYRTTGRIDFTSDPLEKTDATGLVVIVVDTPEGPSVFGTETALGVTEHEEAAKEALASLSGID